MAKTRIVRTQRGQASLMIGMMMLTFILLFAFVVNTGMLINAKINLQNAADLAAYAGAAVQARQMNDISYLNYEMRRQYKKFLYRYYVIGNMASANFPRQGTGTGGTPIWGPDLNDNLYGVPAVCVAFSTTGQYDNYCQLQRLIGITIPSTSSGFLGAFDQINAVLAQQLQAIEQLREQNCGKIATANTTLLMLWLFNTSPDLKSLTAAIAGGSATAADERAILQISQAAAQGLGLIPREIILKERINTLASYVNMPPVANVTKAVVDGFQQSIDPPADERTIQAFLSAYYTLGNHTFSDDRKIVMDELLPSAGDQAGLLKLNPLTASFDNYSVQFTAIPNNNGTSDCVPQLTPIPVQNVPLGFAKDPSVLTFYAIRLRATARVMFSPFGDVDLTAYAAARPFGSRIGPQTAVFTMPGTGKGASGNLSGQLPNLPITQADMQGLAPGKGWDNDTILNTLYSQFFQSGQPVTTNLQGANFESGTRAGMVPNPIEGNIYNILNEAKDPFVTTFDALHQISFWAPIISPANISNLKNVLSQDLAPILTRAGNPTNAMTGANSSSLLTAFAQSLLDYVDSLEQGEGEVIAGSPDASGHCTPGSCDQEGINIAHIQDPFVGPDGKPIQLSSSIMIQPDDIRSLKTSYVTNLNLDYQNEGRVGYSVKYVSFDSLTKTGTDTTGSGTIVKPPGFFDGTESHEVLRLQH